MNNLTVVTYHFVRKKSKNILFKNLKYLNIIKFKKQISFFKKNYNFIDPNYLELYKNEKIKLPKKPIMLTFDDGYKDHFSYVLPILKKNNIKAIFFPISSTINTNTIIQANIIQLLLGVVSIDKIYEEIHNLVNVLSFRLKTKINIKTLIAKIKNNKNRTFDKSKVIICKKLLQTYLPLKLRNTILNILYKKYINIKKKNLNKILYMSLRQLKILKKNRMVIGSHTHTHQRFSHLNIIQKKYEIKKSLNFLISNKIVDFKKYYFCYPYGDHDKISDKLLKKHNFIFAFNTIPKINHLTKNIFNLNRYDANDFIK
jgi:peptidoglycan/xylan/chitin deacetylase (PgdA/CDA1 family)